MKHAKAEASGAGRDHNPFDRFARFVKRIVAVPKSELPAQEREFQRAKKKRKQSGQKPN